MSAIVAAAARELSEHTRTWIVEATAYCAYAGPDAQATAIRDSWGLGHAMLQTGRAEPEQPLTRDGRVWLTADVRLDARADLVSSLRAHGQPVDAGASDPELLLAAYYAWGDALTEHIAGDFAFALWDDARGRLLCARDQIGVVPLHYARVGDELLVATALNALLLHPAVSDQLDDAAVADFLVRGCCDFAATTFRSIRRVPPAHTAAWVDRDLRVRRYWRQAEWRPLVRFKTAEEYVQRFQGLLETAVAERITADRLAVQVSGGMDSTSVAAFASAVIAKRGLPNDAIRGSTMVLGGASGDQEGHFAQLMSRATGIELDVVDESLLEPIDPLADSPTPPEPTLYRWSSMEYRAVLRCAEHARLLLTGFPGDGLLMFVPWYWAEWLRRGHLHRLTQAFVDNARLFRARPHLGLRQNARLRLGALASTVPAVPGWLAADFAARAAIANRTGALGVSAASSFDIRSLSREPLWSALFASADPSATGVPLQMRHPLADLRLVDFAARLPPEPWLVGKRILREATHDLLPEAVRTRPKALLVRGPRGSITPEALERLEQLVRALPGLDEFLDRAALIDAIMTPAAAVEHSHNQPLLRTLGLVHWLAHWRRPVAAAWGSGRVQEVSILD